MFDIYTDAIEAAQPPAASDSVIDQLVKDNENLRAQLMNLPEDAPAAPSDLAALCKEMLSGDRAEFKSNGPLMKVLAQEIGGECAEVGAINRTIRRALEVVAGGAPAAQVETDDEDDASYERGFKAGYEVATAQSGPHRSSAEQHEEATLQICFDKVAKERDQFRAQIKELSRSTERYMRAVAALGKDSGYNKLTYFEAPILNMPTEEMKTEAHNRWLELNDAGIALTLALQPEGGK